MYFVPALFALATFLVLPSWVAAVSVGLFCWIYLQFAGRKPRAAELATIKTELAFRTLSVKALAISGDYDQITFDVHAVNTPDMMENSALRALLRDAAGATHDGWKQAARRVRQGARKKPQMLHTLMTGLVIQMTSQPSARIPGSRYYKLSDEKQKFLMELGKMWGIGPRTLRGILEKNEVAPSAELAFAR